MQTLDIDAPTALISEATLTYKSFGTGELQFSRPCASLDEPQPFAVGDEYVVTRGGQTLIAGPVTQCERRLSGSGFYWSVVISDFWWYLETCLYISYSQDKGTVAPAAHVYVQAGAGEATRATMSLGDAINQILSNNTRFGSIDWTLEVDEAAAIIPFTADLTKHADLLRACQKWRPTLASYWDYSTPDAPRLVITDAGDVVTIDRADLLTDVVLRPRPDLIPPAVGILGTGTSTANAKVYTMSVWPEGGDDLLKEPYALTMAVNLPSGTQTKSGDETTDNANQAAVDAAAHTSAAFAPRMVVRGKAFPPDDMIAWWQSHIPLLKDVERDRLMAGSAAQTTAIDSDAKDVGGYTGTVLSHEFVSGQHNGTDRLKWSEVQVTQTVYYDGTPPPAIAGYFPTRVDEGGYYKGEFTAKFYMIDRHYYSYAIDANSTPLGGEGEPDPEPEPYDPPAAEESEQSLYDDIVKAVWESSQRLEYEGSITLVAGPDVRTGMRLNLTGTAPEYADMQTTVQTVSIDLATGLRTIDVGPAEHLSIQTMIERARALQAQSSGGEVAEEDEAINAPSGSNSAQMPDDQRPDAPVLSPKWEFAMGAGLAEPIAEFSVRSVVDESTGNVSYQYQQGTVIGPTNQIKVGAPGWNSLAITSGPIYCNITLDRNGSITAATLSSTDNTSAARPKVYAYGRKGISGAEYRPGQGAPFNPTGGTYCVQIAEITNQVVTMHHLGVITLPLLPQYVIYQLDDYTANPAADKTGADASAQSLIATNDDTHAYLRKLSAGEGIKFGRLNNDDTTPPAGEIRINATALPSHYYSESTGLDLFEEQSITPSGESEAVSAYVFRSLKAMTIQETRTYADELGVTGAPCQVILVHKYDAAQHVNDILIGAVFNTFASGL